VRSILQRSGYLVLDAPGGPDALLLCEQHQHIDLLLTDVVMPRMSGAQLAAQLHVQRPELKVLYMSGYTENAVVLHGVLRAEVAFVQKPITPAVLLTRVREVLDAPLLKPSNEPG
jgi:two-component system cell cycle sensor histidine kinase/response regulator CckA